MKVSGALWQPVHSLGIPEGRVSSAHLVCPAPCTQTLVLGQAQRCLSLEVVASWPSQKGLCNVCGRAPCPAERGFQNHLPYSNWLVFEKVRLGLWAGPTLWEEGARDLARESGPCWARKIRLKHGALGMGQSLTHHRADHHPCVPTSSVASTLGWTRGSFMKFHSFIS